MADATAYEFGGFVLQRSQQRVLRCDGTTVELTPRLFSALLFFVEHPGELLGKETLLQALWPGLVVEENNLSQVVAGLRRALGDDTQGSRFIQTVPRRGFRFVADVVKRASVEASEEAANETTALAQVPLPVDSGRRSQLRLALGAGAALVLGGVGWWTWRRPSVGTPNATLAVLPFKPLAAASRDELLEVGMADSLIARLSTIPGLVVRSTGSVLQYAGPVQDPVRAARELNVTWIVDGSLQRHGDLVRATARLLHAPDGVAAWSGGFDEKFTSVFEVQDQISNRVTQALMPLLHVRVDAVPELLEIGGTRNLDAYQLYLAGRWRAQGSRGAELEKGIALLNQALSIDPSYAMAWVELAHLYRRKLWVSDGLASEVFSAANAAVQRALTLSPILADAHASLGFSRHWFEYDWTGAEQAFRHAQTLNPNCSIAHWGLASLLLSQGRLVEGFTHQRLARSLDPMSPVFNTVEGSFLLADGRLEEARMRLNRSLEIAPNNWLTHLALGLLLMAERHPEQGIASIRHAVAVSDGTTRPWSVLGVQLARVGEATETSQILDRLLTESKTRYVTPTSIASLHAALGETDLALTALEQGFKVRDTRMIYLKDDPHWTDLRTEPRFRSLLKALKLDSYGPGLTPI